MRLVQVVPGGTVAGDDLPADLRRSHALARFPRGTESAYQVWLRAQVVPLIVVVTVGSALTWLAVPFASRWWIEGDALTQMMLISFVINLPTSLAVLVVCRWAPRWALGAMVVALTIVYLTTLYGLRNLYDTLGGLAPNAILFAFLAPAMRFPWRTSAAVVVGACSSATAMVAAGVAAGEVTWAEAGPWLQLIVLTVGFALGTAAIGEGALRSRFASERLIERQQEQLVRGRELLRRYAPPAVVERIETGRGTDIDAPQRRRVTILFSDVAGFTTLADRLDPEALSQVLNEYLGAMAEAVHAHGGTLNEFAGDGFMAIFGAPDEMAPEDQVLAAVRTARSIFARLPDLNEGWFRLGIDEPLQTRIGINTGVLSVGTFGSAGRATYTAIGLPTNIAARIEAQCRPGQMLLSHTSWQLVKHEVPCEERGTVDVKGVHYPIRLFRPLDEPGNGERAAGVDQAPQSSSSNLA